MTALRQKMIEDLQLRGYAPGTQEAYVRAVGQLAEYYAKGPNQLNEEDLRPGRKTRQAERIGSIGLLCRNYPATRPLVASIIT